MGQLRRPSLEPGYLDDLVRKMHELHDAAGRPSLRVIVRALPPASSWSHTAVHDVFSKQRRTVPEKSLVMAVGRFLVTLIDPGMDVEKATIAGLDALWLDAAREPFRVYSGSQFGERRSDTHVADPQNERAITASIQAESDPDRSPLLGASFTESATSFAVFSEFADAVELCLLGPGDDAERRVPLMRLNGHVWHVTVADIRHGQHYGYRVHGPHDPSNGLRFNPSKLLLDPYARAITGRLSWDDSVFAYSQSASGVRREDSDSAAFVPKSMVIDPSFDWRGDVAPRIPYSETVIYEAHVRGMTATHPAVPAAEQGKFLGLTHPALLEHYRGLGVTALQLMPVAHFEHAHHLVKKGLLNYWGYDPIGHFAPHADYATRSGGPGAQVQEFKEMVRRLHGAGFEIILDVVFNHTVEGNDLGPTLCLRGMDNPTYYRLDPDDKRRYRDFTDTGNTLNAAHPQVVQLITDALRYWVLEMHVDGFRFDLAPTLVRDSRGEFSDANALLAVLNQDPVLSHVKLIAEPWDVPGYRLGTFPHPWMEWNDRYRDSVRRFWMSPDASVADFATRLAGSSDFYQHPGRLSTGSVNFVTCHDGFTLQDLVSYTTKNNEKNGEGNRDGLSTNHSFNHGTEGSSDDPIVLARRDRTKRALLATLAVSRGVPMILHGDEFGRTQEGNNNAYCQNSEQTWLDWSMADAHAEFLQFVRDVLAFRRENPLLRRLRFANTAQPVGAQPKSCGNSSKMVWLSAAGSVINQRDWDTYSHRYIAVYLDDEQDEQIVAESAYLLLFNALDDHMYATMPHASFGSTWAVVLDTDIPTVVDLRWRASDAAADRRLVYAGEAHRISAKTLQVLRRVRGQG